MSVELQQVKRRIRTTRQVRQVTAALQRVSAARLAQTRRTLQAADRYRQRLEPLIAGLLAAEPDLEHPFLRAGDGPDCLLVFGGDRGLCGGYNSAVSEQMMATVSSAAERPHLIVMGRVIARRASRLGLTVDRRLHQPPPSGVAAVIDRIAALLHEGYRAGTYGRVKVLFMRFASGLAQQLTVRTLLPVAPQERADATLSAVATFEPEPRNVLDELLLPYLRACVRDTLLSSIASENAARQMAMTRASENAGEILRDLQLRYSRLRQEDITEQMIEIAAGMQTTV